MDSFLSGVSPVRPVAATNSSTHLNSTLHADEASTDSNRVSSSPNIGPGFNFSPSADSAHPQTPPSAAPISPEMPPTLALPAKQLADAPPISAAVVDCMHDTVEDDGNLDVVDIDSESGQ